MKQVYQLAILLGLLPNVSSAQYFQSFDSAAMPSDWTVINGGDQETWRTWDAYDTTFNASHSGSHFLGLQYRDAAGDYVISPAIVVTAGVSDKLTFWAKNRGAGLTEKIDVKVSATTPTAEAFTKTIAKDLQPTTSWTQYTYDLSDYIGQKIYIGFYSATQDMWFIGIDDFRISGSDVKISQTDIPKFSVYPNPVKDFLNISSNAKIKEISIYDLSGKLHKNEILNTENAKINVKDLPSGHYILKVKEDFMEKSYRIVKK